MTKKKIVIDAPKTEMGFTPEARKIVRDRLHQLHPVDFVTAPAFPTNIDIEEGDHYPEVRIGESGRTIDIKGPEEVSEKIDFEDALDDDPLEVIKTLGEKIEELDLDESQTLYGMPPSKPSPPPTLEERLKYAEETIKRFSEEIKAGEEIGESHDGFKWMLNVYKQTRDDLLIQVEKKRKEKEEEDKYPRMAGLIETAKLVVTKMEKVHLEQDENGSPVVVEDKQTKEIK